MNTHLLTNIATSVIVFGLIAYIAELPQALGKVTIVTFIAVVAIGAAIGLGGQQLEKKGENG